MKHVLKNHANHLIMLLAMALTLSCSSDEVKDFLEGGSSSSGGGSSSSIAAGGGGNSSSGGAAALPSSSSRAGNGYPDFPVSTAAEFVAAIGSDRNIVLSEGAYNLSDPALRQIENDNVSWEEVNDGYQMNVNGVSNMTIQGTGVASLIVEPRYAYVIRFAYSANVAIENVTAGHSEGGYCSGGVFAFIESSIIRINNTNMFGSGSVGLYLDEVLDMEVANSTIFECTYNIMNIYNSQDISFKDSYFFENGEFDLVEIFYTSNVVFDGCDFSDNRSMYNLFRGENSDVLIKNTDFYDNDTQGFASSESNAFTFDYDTCVFERNSWDYND